MEIFGIDTNSIAFLIVGFVIILGFAIGIVKSSRYCIKHGLKFKDQVSMLYITSALVCCLYVVGIIGSVQTKDIIPVIVTTILAIWFLGVLFVGFPLWEVIKHKRKNSKK